MDLSQTALFLDLDGTLAPIVPDPRMVGPDSRRGAVLADAARALGGRIAIVSGRTIADLDRILEGRIAAIAGLHGLERRSADGRATRAAAPPGMNLARAEAQAFAAAHSGVMIEDKALSLAIHYRAAPASAAEARALAEACAARHGLVVQHGKMVVEIRAGGPDKGDAVAAFMREPPFSGAAPIFVGDDLTDEAGFLAARRLGGAGVLVGPPRTTSAAAILPDADAVLSWIETALRRGAFSLEFDRSVAPWAG
ncbi:MAG: trehalose-phosphatase [Alphaproteobacteria bacterium]|nr:trehalose-phosphatase [Alphaproteobacteria bacterium]